MHLFSKLSCGLQDQNAQGAKRISIQLLQYGQNKCRRFASPGLRRPQEIAPSGNESLISS
jgi:hypothetical protein